MIDVLICEDDFRIADIHKSLIEQYAELNCIGKTNSIIDTKRMLEENKVDLLLLDIYLPDDIAVKRLGEFRVLRPNLDVIVVSASNHDEHIKKSLRYGVYDYILKTDSLKRLKSSLTSYIKYFHAIEAQQTFNQDTIDHLIYKQQQYEPIKVLPKGIDGITLDLVRHQLMTHQDGLTAEELSEHLGASRTTARRYLEYLIRLKHAKVMPIYGIVGRPERRYFSL
ncbi:response regulator [Geomicrobium sp. JCM 19038]|uniref:response regulator n=1 Tax=Geomicrobium sp. JCM 19038 TaxID=1460635 RepID=UPI00045F2F68|nr:response regulator [Geomicrobium sp. JCM 19038]GAK08849.1 transcriptional regulatory protein CitB, DpiA [Geomicrobium sp. JCM 19038]